ncbi:MAG: hypothetical protein EOP56_06240 [Sphingobacteriales bacterium]|nr:MAG: hypothetical protein EOP56_06240 [Sphingobacteriales bacterium]
MRTILFAALCLMSFSSKADFVINNTTSCEVKFQVGVDRSGGCSYYNAIVPTTILPGATIVYANPSVIPSTSWVFTPTPIASDVFTWLRVYPSTGTCPGTGNQVSGSCGPFTMGPVSMTTYDASLGCASCGTTNIEWTVVGPDIIVNIYP